MPNYYQLDTVASERHKFDLFEAQQKRLVNLASSRKRRVSVWFRQLLVEREHPFQYLKSVEPARLA